MRNPFLRIFLPIRTGYLIWALSVILKKALNVLPSICIFVLIIGRISLPVEVLIIFVLTIGPKPKSAASFTEIELLSAPVSIFAVTFFVFVSP